MGAGDQAAGLRRWAEQFGQPATVAAEPGRDAVPPAVEPLTLMVVGLPGLRSTPARACLARWQAGGHRWVGDPARWKLVALEADSPHLAVLAEQQSRWALWVEDDGDGFRRAWRILRQLHEAGGPRRLLALHPGIPGPAGLLGNLREAAAAWLDTELLLLPERSGAAC
ncbi:hypothetical protein NGA35_07420 [Pseudomonas stutzeri]|nr:hypothetical protein [Stutzerimonas stutzeri]